MCIVDLTHQLVQVNDPYVMNSQLRIYATLMFPAPNFLTYAVFLTLTLKTNNSTTRLSQLSQRFATLVLKTVSIQRTFQDIDYCMLICIL